MAAGQQLGVGLTVHRPPGVDKALELLDRYGQQAVVCMGGTDLVPRLRRASATPRHVVCCLQLPELHHVTVGPASVLIGAGATYRELSTHPDLATAVPRLIELANLLANIRVRNRGTLGGILCAARPRSDPPTLLAALGAEAVVTSVRGRRHIPVGNLIKAARVTALEPGELLTAVRIPLPEPGARVGFSRIGTSQGPVVNVAVVAAPSSVRMAVGAVRAAPAVTQVVDTDALSAVARDLVDESWTPEEALASRWYSREVAAGLVDRLQDELELTR